MKHSPHIRPAASASHTPSGPSNAGNPPVTKISPIAMMKALCGALNMSTPINRPQKSAVTTMKAAIRTALRFSDWLSISFSDIYSTSQTGSAVAGVQRKKYQMIGFMSTVRLASSSAATTYIIRTV